VDERTVKIEIKTYSLSKKKKKKTAIISETRKLLDEKMAQISPGNNCRILKLNSVKYKDKKTHDEIIQLTYQIGIFPPSKEK
jgi:hypothetical protein